MILVQSLDRGLQPTSIDIMAPMLTALCTTSHGPDTEPLMASPAGHQWSVGRRRRLYQQQPLQPGAGFVSNVCCVFLRKLNVLHNYIRYS